MDVQIEDGGTTSMVGDPGSTRAIVAEQAAAGVTWMVLDPPSDGVEHALDAIGAFGTHLASQVR